MGDRETPVAAAGRVARLREALAIGDDRLIASGYATPAAGARHS